MTSFPTLQLLIHSLCLVTGLTGNSFVLIVLFLDWLRTYVHNPCNLILTGIAISNILLQCSIVFQEVAFIQFFYFYIQFRVSTILYAAVTSFSLSSLCCSTCLCFYYCMKIVQFPGTLFYKLRSKLPVMVPWLLAFSYVLSWSVGISYYWDFYLDISFISNNITTDNSTENLTMISEYKPKCHCVFQIYTFISSVAFTIILLTTGAIITSLCQHMRRMKQNNEDGHCKIKTYVSVAKTMTSLSISYLIFYTAFILQNISSDDDIMTAGYIVISMFPIMNSVILILGNRDLLKVLKKMLCMQPSVEKTEATVIIKTP